MLPSRWLNREGLSVYSLLLVCLVFAPWTESIFNWFSLERTTTLSGEIWRLWTGHFVHLSWAHLLLSALGLVLLQQLFGGYLQTLGLTVGAALLAPLISAGWLVAHAMQWSGGTTFDYVVGMSGLLHGLFVYAACLALQYDRVLAFSVFGILVIKVLAENIFGAVGVSERVTGLPVAADMHLIGVIAGLVLGLAMMRVTARSR